MRSAPWFLGTAAVEYLRDSKTGRKHSKEVDG